MWSKSGPGFDYSIKLKLRGVTRFDDLFPADIYTLLNSSLSASEDNPLHQPYLIVIGDLLRYFSRQPSWRYHSFVERLLEGQEWIICTDKGAGVANAVALQYSIQIDDKVDTEQFESWIPLEDNLYDGFHRFFPRRLRVVKHLVSNIKESLDQVFEEKDVEQANEILGHTERAV